MDDEVLPVLRFFLNTIKPSLKVYHCTQETLSPLYVCIYIVLLNVSLDLEIWSSTVQYM